MLAACIALWLGLLLTLPPRPSPWLVVASGLPVLALASWQAARRRTRPWRAFLDDTADVHGLALVLLYALGVLLRDTHGITTDGVTYFAQLRSLVFDRDLDVARNRTTEDQAHWVVWNIPAGATGMPEGVARGSQLADGSFQISATGFVYRGPGAPAFAVPLMAVPVFAVPAFADT